MNNTLKTTFFLGIICATAVVTSALQAGDGSMPTLSTTNSNDYMSLFSILSKLANPNTHKPSNSQAIICGNCKAYCRRWQPCQNCQKVARIDIDTEKNIK